jgi:hypothetical protein
MKIYTREIFFYSPGLFALLFSFFISDRNVAAMPIKLSYSVHHARLSRPPLTRGWQADFA